MENRVEVLDKISSLFDSGCHLETIALGQLAREEFRDKHYSVVAETTELLTPEGTMTDYVMESYERAYLSFLISSSYRHIHKLEDSQVELRRSYQEIQSWIYNYGEDPVNLILQAALWENSFSPSEARPFWKRVSESFSSDIQLQVAAAQQLAQIDMGTADKRPWKIYALGKFPELNWNFNMEKSAGGYYDIKSSRQFAPHCSGGHGVLVSTESWARKISHRYDHEYHPLLNIKSWTRFPVGVTYGVATAATGFTVGLSGCVADAYLQSSQANLCKYSMQYGAEIMAKSGPVIEYALQPDLRHWQQVPEAFWLTKDDQLDDSCLTQFRQNGFVSVRPIL